MAAQCVRLTLPRCGHSCPSGLKVLEGELQGLPPSSVVGADVAFKLYDTYGFPLDLTQVRVCLCASTTASLSWRV